jgi:hypothetical protein
MLRGMIHRAVAGVNKIVPEVVRATKNVLC